jgi:hypothetical protein
MPASLLVDLREVERLVLDLEQFAKRGLPFAARKSLTGAAFQTRKVWQKQIDISFTLRNTYVVRSVRAVKATGSDIDHMVSEVGSTADFMAKQEKGATIRGRRTHKPIPTSVAAGQSEGAERTKVVRRANWQRAISLGKRFRGGSKQNRNAAAIGQAVRSGRRFVLLELKDQRMGIARVTGRKRLTVRLIWDLSHRSVHVHAEPTLQRSLDAVQPWLLPLYRDNLVQQCRFHRVRGYASP